MLRFWKQDKDDDGVWLQTQQGPFFCGGVIEALKFKIKMGSVKHKCFNIVLLLF